MLIGEGPGEVEAENQRPFCGPSGQSQESWLQRAGASSKSARLNNIIQEYTPGNPDPTRAQIAYWTPILEAEIRQVRPRLIVAVGRFAMRWLLGEAAELDACHGMPYAGGALDPTIAYRANGAIVIPVVHPAAGLRRDKRALERRTLIAWDYCRVADALRLVQGGRLDLLKPRLDPYAGREKYADLTGAELATLIHKAKPERIALDTEGYLDEDPADLWLQVSWEPGTAYSLRARQPDLWKGIEALQWLTSYARAVFVTHDASTPQGIGYDTQVARAMGLELCDSEHGNTMYDAFLQRIESRALKMLMWRWCGMRQDPYEDIIGDISRNKQIEWLRLVAAANDWQRIPARVEQENNGVLKVKKFGKLESRAKQILGDIEKGKWDKDGKLTDPDKRWKQLEPELRSLAHARLGKLPVGNLYDLPDFDQAVHYACRDADGTGRVDTELAVERRRMGVEGVYWTGMQVLPIFEEMQQVGMSASRTAFVELATTVDREMKEIQAGISANWFGGQPINPAPNTKDVEKLVLGLGITGLKKTKKAGLTSTSMKALEFYAAKYPAIRAVGEWRRRQKVLTTYCLPLIQIADRQFAVESRALDGQSDLFLVRCKLNPFLETRRLAAKDPSLLNQPVRTDLGRKVRGCYMTVLAANDDPDDPNVEVFGDWDFNSQEVRVTAHVTQDRLLCAIMRDPSRKIHMETASRIFGKPIDQIHEINEKIPAKTAFFGMLYGLSGLGLLDLFMSFGAVKATIEPVLRDGQWGLEEVHRDWALDDCEKLIEEIFKIYPGLSDTINAVEKETRRTGVVRDLYGHIRYLPAIWSGNRGEAAEAKRQAFSHLVSATAQGVTQNTMASLRWPIRDLQKKGLPVWWTLQIHDSLMFRMPRWLFPVMDKLVVGAMENGHSGPTNVRFSVPILADGHMSTRWGPTQMTGKGGGSSELDFKGGDHANRPRVFRGDP